MTGIEYPHIDQAPYTVTTFACFDGKDCQLKQETGLTKDQAHDLRTAIHSLLRNLDWTYAGTSADSLNNPRTWTRHYTHSWYHGMEMRLTLTNLTPEPCTICNGKGHPAGWDSDGYQQYSTCLHCGAPSRPV